MADKTYDVEQFATQIGNALQMLKAPEGQDPTGLNPTGDVISQTGQMTPQQSTTTAASGGLSGDQYDGFSVSQEYGVNGHPGIDIATPVGTKLIAPIAGKVTHAADDDPNGYGSWVEITGADGTVVRYGHLSGINVNVGDAVTPGMLIGATGGAVGSKGAGNADGPHLHFEVHVAQGGPAVDPTHYLAGGWQILGSR